MLKYTHFYLIRIEFLGFRYHGWQKQPKFKSVHGMIDKTVEFVLGHTNFKTLGCGRTDAKVSADDYAFELFFNDDIIPERLLHSLNKNLPSDIRAKSIDIVDSEFNIIQDVKMKEYHYHFSSGEKSHPFNAPFIRDFGKALNMDDMMAAVQLFEGKHNFKRYVSKPVPKTVFERNIISSVIEPNTKFSDGFTASNAFVYKVKAKGFLRYQVRLMMGALVEVGRGVWSVDDLKQSLIDYEGTQIKHVAPSSGLTLHMVEFD
ncbi:MAG: tRNA pseudouridine(38-40) synthase TruA [Cyclobacteriaceae bacterium]|nr:tRNA pseudouridine(38-40) synthase TruA [Cyclobacteriaceae bacterium]